MATKSYMVKHMYKKLNKTYNFLLQNKLLFFITCVYAIVILSIITWGIPNKSHPFTYHMDEWHQMQAVRNTFRFGSPNVPGSAHGPIFQFLVSGLFLAPFIILGVLNPFLIKSPLGAIYMQERLFIILRLNTLIFGVLSLIVIYLLSKKYLKINPILNVLFMVLSPVWIVLSNYFKYDIALVFWIILSIFLLLRYGRKPTFKNYVLAGISCSLALATKISALPIIPIYIFSFFFFTPKWNKRWVYLLCGSLIFLGIFLLLGVPDLLIGKGDYREYLSTNLVTGPQGDSNYLLGVSNVWVYLLTRILPPTFGHIFYLLFATSLIYWIVIFVRNKKNLDFYRTEFYLLICLSFFVLSLLPLTLGASGNRVLVLLPFLSLLSSSCITHVLKSKRIKRIVIIIILIFLFTVQSLESSIFIYGKLFNNPLEESSIWIVKNIPKDTTIGLENIPIYETIPDILLKEFYILEQNKYAKTDFKYVIVDSSTETMPSLVVISNRRMHEKYLKKSSKKDLINRLEKEHYFIIAEFFPFQPLFALFGNDLNFHLSGLAVEKMITVYRKN